MENQQRLLLVVIMTYCFLLGRELDRLRLLSPAAFSFVAIFLRILGLGVFGILRVRLGWRGLLLVRHGGVVVGGEAFLIEAPVCGKKKNDVKIGKLREAGWPLLKLELKLDLELDKIAPPPNYPN